MSNLIDGKIYVAPNGNTKVKLYPHGFIQPVSEISQDTGDLIEEMSCLSQEVLIKEGNPRPTLCQIYEKMGWKEVKDETGPKKKKEFKPKELIESIDEYWQKECLENIFGDEHIFNIEHESIEENEDGDTIRYQEYELEVVLRRKALKNG